MPRQQNPMRRSWLAEGKTEGWIAHRLELMVSPSWRHRPVPLIRILERIEIEHLRHGGAENGSLTVAYDQFVAFGVSRRVVAPALECAVHLGLLEIRQVDEVVSNIRAANSYRLTYVPEKGKRAPTDEWAGISNDVAIAAAEHFRNLQKKSGGQSPFQQPTSSLSCNSGQPTSSLSCKSPVPQREHTLKSGGITADTAQDAPEEAPPQQGARPPEERTSGQPLTVVDVSPSLINSRALRGLGPGPSKPALAASPGLRAALAAGVRS